MLLGVSPVTLKKCVGISITHHVQAAPSADKGLDASPDVCSVLAPGAVSRIFGAGSPRFSSTKYEYKLKLYVGPWSPRTMVHKPS